MKMKTSESFFPTKISVNIKSPSESNIKKFKLIKKRECLTFDQRPGYKQGEGQRSGQPSTSNIHAITPQQVKYSSTVNSKGSQTKKNIFYDEDLPNLDYKFDERFERPVGGMEIFNKQDRSHRGALKTGKQLQSKRDSLKQQKNIQSKFRRSVPQNNDNFQVFVSTPFMSHQQSVNDDDQEQVFKVHESYESTNQNWKTKKSRPSTSGTYKPKNTHNQISNSRSTASYNNKFRDTSKHNKWVTEQNRVYQAKMGVRNQIFFKQPLIQRYGDRYFEFMLRNRYQQDFQPPQYIHQIEQEQEPQYINKDRFINKLRKMKPNIKNYQKLTIKGHKTGLNSNISKM